MDAALYYVHDVALCRFVTCPFPLVCVSFDVANMWCLGSPCGADCTFVKLTGACTRARVALTNF
jgi:hypothetical protein